MTEKQSKHLAELRADLEETEKRQRKEFRNDFASWVDTNYMLTLKRRNLKFYEREYGATTAPA